MKQSLVPAVRGMRDILPTDIGNWRRLERTAAAVFARYGYGEIRTPLLERADLFHQPIGENTDVVQKEMYQFTDAGGDPLALRPEATVPTVRALIAADMQRAGLVRVWYGGAMFRRERPQKGRYRQFHQLGAEALGSPDPAIDAEQLLMQHRLWRELGIADSLQLHLNNLGSAAERARHRAKFAAYLRGRQADLDTDSRRRIDANPLRVLDSKDPRTQAVCAAAPPLADDIGPDSRRHLDAVREKLAAAGIAHTVNPSLVRGLDYYNLTVYEWSPTDDDRRQNTLCGGGRYDGLAERIGGAAWPGCGFAIGMERVLDLLPPAPPPPPDCFLALADHTGAALAHAVAEHCRDDGLAVWQHAGGAPLGKQLKRADSMGAPLAIIVGKNECDGGYITIKRLSDGASHQAPPAQAAANCRRMLNA